jgi:hypothetical protein
MTIFQEQVNVDVTINTSPRRRNDNDDGPNSTTRVVDSAVMLVEK